MYFGDNVPANNVWYRVGADGKYTLVGDSETVVVAILNQSFMPTPTATISYTDAPLIAGESKINITTANVPTGGKVKLYYEYHDFMEGKSAPEQLTPMPGEENKYEVTAPGHFIGPSVLHVTIYDCILN